MHTGRHSGDCSDFSVLKAAFNELGAASGCFVWGWVCLLKKLKIKTCPYPIAVLASSCCSSQSLDACLSIFAKGLLIFNFCRSVAASGCICSIKTASSHLRSYLIGFYSFKSSACALASGQAKEKLERPMPSRMD